MGDPTQVDVWMYVRRTTVLETIFPVSELLDAKQRVDCYDYVESMRGVSTLRAASDG